MRGRRQGRSLEINPGSINIHQQCFPTFYLKPDAIRFVMDVDFQNEVKNGGLSKDFWSYFSPGFLAAPKTAPRPQNPLNVLVIITESCSDSEGEGTCMSEKSDPRLARGLPKTSEDELEVSTCVRIASPPSSFCFCLATITESYGCTCRRA